MGDRRKFNSFMNLPERSLYRTIVADLEHGRDVLETFAVDRHPFVPRDKAEKYDRCHEIFRLQSTGLAERMRKTGICKAVLALSGGWIPPWRCW
jgi:NAD+ synthase (glutamine-hydrolysing)